MTTDLDDAAQYHLLRTIAEKRAGADQAVRKLYAHYSQRMLAYFKRHHQSDADTEDLRQQTIVKMVRNAGQCNTHHVSAWIWRIAHNELVDHVRRTSKEPALLGGDSGWEDNISETLPSWGSDPADEHEHDLDDCLAEQFLRFKRDHPLRGEALRLAKEEGWRIEQLAIYLGRSEGATRQFISQCRKKLAAYLEVCRHLLKN